MESNILHYFSKINAQYLHANGEFATKFLIQKLDCQPNTKILEIGFGTGTTLLYLFSIYRNTRFYGLEQSHSMYKKAGERFRFCCVNEHIELSLMTEKNKLPFENNTFDKIYVESVLAIQEGNDLQFMVKEIGRVLKPNGTLVINETIWLDKTPLAEIKRINAFGKQAFGIIQSSEVVPYLADWQKLFEQENLICISTHKFTEMQGNFDKHFHFPYSFLSFIFTAIGKVKAFFSPSMRREKKYYIQKMQEVIPANVQLMEGLIMCFYNQNS